MSLSSAVGRTVLQGLVVWLIVKGAIVIRPAQTIAAMSALIAGLIGSCAGADSSSHPASTTRTASATSTTSTSSPRGSASCDR